jgi:putative aldouronate transport system substrate-binding protein
LPLELTLVELKNKNSFIRKGERKMKKVFGLLLAVLVLFTVAACKDDPVVDPTDDIDYESEVTVDMAINYKGSMFITYNKDTSYQALNGEVYTKGDLLPAWEAIGEALNINFVDKAVSSDEDTDAQFERLQTEQFSGVDVVNGTGANIGPEGVNGNFVDLSKYLDSMPNLSAFLDANPAVVASMTSADGGIYFTPYFDGFGEIEQMYLMRIDWVRDILDADDTSAFDTTAAVLPDNYDRRDISVPIDTDITVANSDGTTRVVNKAYSANILDVLAALPASATGKDIADAFRTHMENTYGDQGYANLSDVFVGTDAAYDTDELLAMMYVIKSNPEFLTREFTDGAASSVEVYFPREPKGSRIKNLFRGLEMFGLRGVFSRHQWLYFDEAGDINDIRHEERFIDGVDDLSNMYNDGLILQNPEDSTITSNWRTYLLSNSIGFMTYDYNASSTAQGLIDAGSTLDPTYEFQAVLPPVVDWLEDGNYFHFTEGVRSLKNEAWGIPAHVEDDTTKLYRILKMVDEMYDYEEEDSIGTMGLYGPEGWTDGTLDYNGDTVYKMSDEALAEMQDLAGGNMINYLRQYVGATLPIGHIRSLGLEFQTLSEDGQEGIDRINTAVQAGTFLLAGQVDTDNPWYNLSPTFYPLTKQESLEITASATFTTVFSDDNLITMVKYGFSGNGESYTKEDYMDLFMQNGIDVYTEIYIANYRNAYERIGDEE